MVRKNWVVRSMYMNVVGRGSSDRSRLTWDVVLQDDLRVKELSRNATRDLIACRDATS